MAPHILKLYRFGRFYDANSINFQMTWYIQKHDLQNMQPKPLLELQFYQESTEFLLSHSVCLMLALNISSQIAQQQLTAIELGERFFVLHPWNFISSLQSSVWQRIMEACHLADQFTYQNLNLTNVGLTQCPARSESLQTLIKNAIF